MASEAGHPAQAVGSGDLAVPCIEGHGGHVTKTIRHCRHVIIEVVASLGHGPGGIGALRAAIAAVIEAVLPDRIGIAHREHIPIGIEGLRGNEAELIGTRACPSGRILRLNNGMAKSIGDGGIDQAIGVDYIIGRCGRIAVAIHHPHDTTEAIIWVLLGPDYRNSDTACPLRLIGALR